MLGIIQKKHQQVLHYQLLMPLNPRLIELTDKNPSYNSLADYKMLSMRTSRRYQQLHHLMDHHRAGRLCQVHKGYPNHRPHLCYGFCQTEQMLRSFYQLKQHRMCYQYMKHPTHNRLLKHL
jgi:hypothetical protein